MQLNILPHHKIDVNKWNSRVYNSFNGDIFHLYWFLNITSNNNWKALIIDDYKTVVPLPSTKNNSLISPKFFPFTTFISDSKINRKLQKSIINLLINNYKTCNIVFHKYNDLSTEEDFISAQNYFTLDLYSEYEDFLHIIPVQTQELIAKAQLTGFHVNYNISTEGIIEFLIDTNYFTNLNEADDFKNLLLIAKEKKFLIPYAVYDKRFTLMAIAILFKFKSKLSLFALSYKKSDTEIQNLALSTIFANIVKNFSANNFTLNIYPWILKNFPFSITRMFNFQTLKLYKLNFKTETILTKTLKKLSLRKKH